MTNFAHGRDAETAAVNYLVRHGYEVIGQNWRTRLCEIDIIARKNDVVYFVEVKYRAGTTQGSGLDYITPRKLKQMYFAARMWVQDNDWDGDYDLAALEVSGETYEVTDFVTELG
jgi:putative endonuclease